MRAAGALGVAVLVLLGFAASAWVSGCGPQGADPEAFPTVTDGRASDTDGEATDGEAADDDTSTDETTTDTTTDGGGSDGRTGCFLQGPMEVCVRPGPEECTDLFAQADAVLESGTADEATEAAAHLARAVALICRNEQPDLARADLEIAREHEDDLNEFARGTLQMLDADDLSGSRARLEDEILSRDAGSVGP